MTIWNAFFLSLAAVNLGLMPLAIEDRNWRWFGGCLLGLLSACGALSI